MSTQAPSDWKKPEVKVAIVGIIVAAVITLVVAFVPIVHDYIFKAKPRIEGAITIPSIGPSVDTTPDMDPRGALVRSSIMVLVDMQNISEVPFVPASYRLFVLLNNQWEEAPLDGRSEDHRIVFEGERSADINRTGTWTACIKPERYLLSSFLNSTPISRDKPMIGFLRFYSYISYQHFRRMQDMKLLVSDNLGHEFEIHQKRGVSRGTAMNGFTRAIEAHTTLREGNVPCPKPAS